MLINLSDNVFIKVIKKNESYVVEAVYNESNHTTYRKRIKKSVANDKSGTYFTYQKDGGPEIVGNGRTIRSHIMRTIEHNEMEKLKAEHAKKNNEVARNGNNQD